MVIKTIFLIDGMECPSCAMKLEGIEDIEGVRGAQASYIKGHMVVNFDEDKISEDQISAEISRLGYTVKGVVRA